MISRNILIKLNALKIAGGILFASALTNYLTGGTGIAILLSMAFFLLACVKITDVTIASESLHIKRYHIFGLRSKAYAYSPLKQTINIQLYDYVGSEDRLNGYDGGTGLGCIGLLVSMFVEARYCGVIVFDRDRRQILNVALTASEFDLVKRLF